MQSRGLDVFEQHCKATNDECGSLIVGRLVGRLLVLFKIIWNYVHYDDHADVVGDLHSVTDDRRRCGVFLQLMFPETCLCHSKGYISP